MYSLSLLLRYLNRVARHPTLREDPDFRQFLEADVVLNDSLLFWPSLLFGLSWIFFHFAFNSYMYLKRFYDISSSVTSTLYFCLFFFTFPKKVWERRTFLQKQNKTNVNPVSPNTDQHQFSPNDIHTLSRY